MPDLGEARVAAIEAHEEFLQHVEAGRARIRTLALVTVVVAFILCASYAYQIALPFATGTKTVTVNLADPSLIASEVVVLALTAAWLWLGVANYLFVTRLGRAIQKARTFEAELDRRMGEGLS